MEKSAKIYQVPKYSSKQKTDVDQDRDSLHLHLPLLYLHVEYSCTISHSEPCSLSSICYAFRTTNFVTTRIIFLVKLNVDVP